MGIIELPLFGSQLLFGYIVLPPQLLHFPLQLFYFLFEVHYLPLIVLLFPRFPSEVKAQILDLSAQFGFLSGQSLYSFILCLHRFLGLSSL
jgi:hypothetical protein